MNERIYDLTELHVFLVRMPKIYFFKANFNCTI